MEEQKNEINSEVVDKEILFRLKEYIRRYYRNHGKMPVRKIMRSKFNLNDYKLSQYINTLTLSGFLKKNYCHYKPTNKENVERIREKKKNDIILLVLRILMIIIGIGAIILSVYYTAIWFCEFLHPILAYIFSTIMVSFSVGIFEVIIILKENKQYKIIMPIILLWTIVLSFSMVSTIAGQYNKRMKNQITEVAEDYNLFYKKDELNNYLKEEERIEKQLQSKAERLESLNKIISEFDYDKMIENEKNYNKLIKEIHTIENEMRILRNNLEKKAEERIVFMNDQDTGITEETFIKEIDFYDWLSSIFKIESKYIQFCLSLFPALFLDIIAPLSVALGMFLKRKDREDEE